MSDELKSLKSLLIYYHFHFMQVRQGAQLERYLIQQEQKPNFTIRREVPL